MISLETKLTIDKAIDKAIADIIAIRQNYHFINGGQIARIEKAKNEISEIMQEVIDQSNKANKQATKLTNNKK